MRSTGTTAIANCEPCGVAMLRICMSEGCETKTLGPYCIDHEVDASDRTPDGEFPDPVDGLKVLLHDTLMPTARRHAPKLEQ